MSSFLAFLTLCGIGLLAFCWLLHIALRNRANLRAGARLGPGSFFLEVTEQKPEPKPTLPEKTSTQGGA